MSKFPKTFVFYFLWTATASLQSSLSLCQPRNSHQWPTVAIIRVFWPMHPIILIQGLAVFYNSKEYVVQNVLWCHQCWKLLCQCMPWLWFFFSKDQIEDVYCKHGANLGWGEVMWRFSQCHTLDPWWTNAKEFGVLFPVHDIITNSENLEHLIESLAIYGRVRYHSFDILL